MEGIILYYVVSPVHVRNAKLLMSNLTEWQLRFVFEKESPWLGEHSFGAIESFPFSAGEISETMWNGNIGAVIFSTVQPREAPIALLQEASKRKVPAIAIEESNQIALTRGMINNYVLPVDYVLVASDYERRGMIDQGFPACRFIATGWPFYGGRVGMVDIKSKTQRKEQFGLDVNSRIAVLTLTGLHDAGESPEVRRRQLTLAARGLPETYQLVIKPHPIESLETLMTFVEECAPQAKVVDGSVRIEELLEAADLLLNRGTSQVCIEALLQEIQVIILDTGINTPFHIISSRVARDSESLRRIVGEIEKEGTSLKVYEPFFREHMPYLPDASRKKTCEQIRSVARERACNPKLRQQQFEIALYEGWLGRYNQARAIIKVLKDFHEILPVIELEKLIDCRVERKELEALKHFLGNGFHSHLLRSLWIDQLIKRKEEIREEDYHWLEDFPPKLQPVWFLSRIRYWALFLARTGNKSRAKRFIDRVYAEHLHVPGIRQIREDTYLYMSSFTGRAIVHLKHISSMRLKKAFPWLVKWVQALRT